MCTCMYVYMLVCCWGGGGDGGGGGEMGLSVISSMYQLTHGLSNFIS